MSILLWYGVDRPEDPMEGSLDEMLEEKGLLPLTSLLLAGTCPCWESIPMFNSLDLVGNRFALLESVVELLKICSRKGGLFANFPIGATMQDGGKRKRGDEYFTILLTLTTGYIFNNVSNFNISFNSFINPATNWGPPSEITLSGNLCNFYTLFLNNFTNFFTIIFSVVTTKCDIFKNLLHTTKIKSWSFVISNFIMKSTNIYYHSFSNTVFSLNFSAGISALFFIL